MNNSMGPLLSGIAQGYGTVMDFRNAEAEADYLKQKRAREAEQQARDDAYRNDMMQAGAPAQVQGVAEQKPDTMDNRDVGQPGEQVLPVSSYAVNGVKFADRAGADAEAAKYNDPAAAVRRQMGVMIRHGRPTDAQGVEATQARMDREKKADNLHEGLRTILGKLESGDWTGVADTFNKSYNNGLNWNIQPNEDGTLNIARSDAQGNPLPGVKSITPDQLRNRILASYDPKLYLDRTDAANAEAVRQRERAENRDYQGGRDTVADKRHADELALRERELRMRQGQAGQATALHTLQMQTEQLKLDAAKAEAKIPPAVRQSFAAAQRDYDTLNAAIARAQAEGSWNDTNPAAQIMTRRMGDAMTRMNRLMEPYLPSSAKVVNPFGDLPTPAAPGAPAAAAARGIPR